MDFVNVCYLHTYLPTICEKFLLNLWFTKPLAADLELSYLINATCEKTCFLNTVTLLLYIVIHDFSSAMK